MARLLNAVLGTPLDKLYLSIGLKLCPTCNLPGSDPALYPYCSKRCDPNRWHRNDGPAVRIIFLTCEECGRLFSRGYHSFMETRQKGQDGIYCGRHCFGIRAARLYGFTAHPENSRANLERQQTHCKRGHPLSGDNLHIYGNQRRCKACARLRARAQTRARRDSAKVHAQPIDIPGEER